VADRALTPATRRRLGKPLPHQQADRPRGHPVAATLFLGHPCEHPKLSGISHSFPWLFQSTGQIPHVLLTRSPVSPTRKPVLPRLACVKRAASVRPEPGSNSPLEISKAKSHKDPHGKPPRTARKHHGPPTMKPDSQNSQKSRPEPVILPTASFHSQPQHQTTAPQPTDPKDRGKKTLAKNTLCSSQRAGALLLEFRPWPLLSQQQAGVGFRTPDAGSLSTHVVGRSFDLEPLEPSVR
jgi:hypothetical protein